MSGSSRLASQTSGILILIITLLFTAVWVRSNYRKDVIILPGRGNSQTSLFSVENSLALQTIKSEWLVENRKPMWVSYRQSVRVDGSELNQPAISWTWRRYGFGQGSNGPDLKFWVIPYWSIVLPLTFISLGLLLGSPFRKAHNVYDPAKT